jgi:hypothetical protein
MDAQKLFVRTAAFCLLAFFAVSFAHAQPSDCCLTLGAQVAALEARLTALEEKTSAMVAATIDDRPAVIFEGVNVHLRDGTGATECDAAGCNGLGNLVIGYNEASSYPQSPEERTGSHNLVVGSYHEFSSHGGMVVGYKNTISGEYASVSGGKFNEAVGPYSSVSGGDENVARARGASVLGGEENGATGIYATVSGGRDNTALANNSSVGGGYNNIARGSYDFLPIGALSNVNYVCGSWVRIPGRTDKQADAVCPKTQIAVGGGFQWQGGPATLNVFMSTRAAPDSWIVRAYSAAEYGNDPADQDMVQACAVCADANP